MEGMATHLGAHLASLREDLRFQPVSRRVRASLDGQPVADTTAACLVWEPHRIVPLYAVPVADVSAGLVPVDNVTPPDPVPPVLPPMQVFEVHLAAGQSYDVVVADRVLERAAYRFDDADLGDHVLLSWAPFDWTEDDTPVMGHPHDPFSRIDVLTTHRHLEVSYDGQVLADSRNARALYESGLPTRYYFPPEDVRMDLLDQSDTRTVCAYKGTATYHSLAGVPDAADLAWSYPDPLHDAEPVRDLVCFYAEWTDLVADGVPVPRPESPFTRRGG